MNKEVYAAYGRIHSFLADLSLVLGYFPQVFPPGTSSAPQPSFNHIGLSRRANWKKPRQQSVRNRQTRRSRAWKTSHNIQPSQRYEDRSPPHDLISNATHPQHKPNPKELILVHDHQTGFNSSDYINRWTSTLQDAFLNLNQSTPVFPINNPDQPFPHPQCDTQNHWDYYDDVFSDNVASLGDYNDTEEVQYHFSNDKLNDDEIEDGEENGGGGYDDVDQECGSSGGLDNGDDVGELGGAGNLEDLVGEHDDGGPGNYNNGGEIDGFDQDDSGPDDQDSGGGSDNLIHEDGGPDDYDSGSGDFDDFDHEGGSQVDWDGGGDGEDFDHEDGGPNDWDDSGGFDQFDDPGDYGFSY